MNITGIDDELDNGNQFGNFGDARLFKRSKKLINDIYKTTGSALSSLGGAAEIKSAYRFFSNSKVTPEKILEVHREKTISRIKEYKRVCFIQDTSDLDYKHMKEVEGLGVLNDTKRPGCSLHAQIAFTPEKLCLGIISADFIKRPAESLGKRKFRQFKPIEEKESYRWIEGFYETCKIAKEVPETEIVVVTDREGDIYELLLESLNCDNNVKLLVRASHDREIDPENGKVEEVPKSEEVIRVRSAMNSAPIIGTCEFDMPKGRGRSGRKVTQTMRAREVTLRPPKYKSKKLSKIKINVVLLKEENPPKGEEPVVWLLLTTLPISTAEEVHEVINLYVARWGIEMYFKVLKSGCKIEKFQFKESDRLLACISMFMIVAWRVLYSTFIGRTSGDLPCTVIFEESEWQAVYATVKKESPPKTPPILEEIMLMVATLGGYRNRLSDPPPGMIVMWRGMQQVHILARGWEAYKNYG